MRPATEDDFNRVRPFAVRHFAAKQHFGRGAAALTAPQPRDQHDEAAFQAVARRQIGHRHYPVPVAGITGCEQVPRGEFADWQPGQGVAASGSMHAVRHAKP